MPELTLPALGVYELCLLAAAGVTALFYDSPAGKKASEQAAREVERTFEKVKESLRRKPRLGPDIIPGPEKDCPKEKKKCPVCGNLVVPGQMVSENPAYLYPPPAGQTPIDKETFLALPQYTGPIKGTKNTYGAQAWRGPDDRLYYRDTKHTGNGAHIEVFDRRGKNHLGTVCPNCGAGRDGPDPRGKKPIL